MAKIKICGLKRKEDIQLVNQWKPDYVGFVFAESSRQITIDQAYEFKNMLHPDICAVGVFVNENPSMIELLSSSRIIDLIQLHGDETPEYMQKVRHKVQRPIIKAVRVKSTEQILEADEWPCEYLLLDTYVKGRYGGSGQCFERSLIPALKKPFFLAGGLNVGNIGGAISGCSPYGVDVSSAVETNGCKDSKKVQELIERVREYE